jgi:hypothetical protein
VGAGAVVTELPENLLRSWPGRFRFAELLVLFAAAGEVPENDTVAAVLDGIIADRTEQEVLAELIDAGHYAAAAQVLDHCDLLSEQDIEQARDRLERSRADHRQLFADGNRQLAELADRAGLGAETDHAQWTVEFERSWPAVEVRLREARTELRGRIDRRAGELRVRAGTVSLPEGARSQFESLLRDDRLRAADNLLRHGLLGAAGPEAVPRLPQWPWPGVAAADVLQWHMSPNSARPPEFTAWEPADDAGRGLLVAWSGLGAGGESAARRFTAALDAFLGPAPGSVHIHPVPGGFLGRLENLFGDDSVGRFGPAGGTDLFIADPTTAAPQEFPGVQRFVAVGSAIREPGGASRGDGAMLTLQDILRLVTVPPSVRQVSLLRILGRQWPLSAFGCGSPADLAQRLGPPGPQRWQHLCMLTDLLGVGGSAAADELIFQGDDERVLYVFLDCLTRPAGLDWRTLNRWRSEKQLAGAVEAAVLYTVETAPLALAAFWAALATAPPGDAVTLSELARTAALSGLDWDRELRDGLAQLSRHWFVAAATPDEVTLRHCGTLIGLTDLAERRLAGLVRRVAEAAADRAADSAPTAWEAYRYALGADWPAYHALYRQAPEADSLPEARLRLVCAPEERSSATVDPVAGGDLVAIIGELRTAFGARFPEIDLAVEGPAELWAEIGDRTAYVLLHELLTNAAEAMPTGGSVVVTMTASDGDALVDVRDTGPGVPAEVDGHKVFRKGTSTRGPGRGHGLWIVRQLSRQLTDCDIDLVSARDGHPVLRGAHFRLVVPLRPGVSQ